MHYNASGENPASAKTDLNASSMLDLMLVLAEEIGLTSRDVSTIRKRAANEGVSFFTKTLPLLAKALDKGLGACQFKLPSNFKRRWRDSEIPAFCGSLFIRVFDKAGHLRSDACVASVKLIRQIGFLFYKYVLPFSYEEKNRCALEFIGVDAGIKAFASTPVSDYARNLTTTVFSRGFDPLDLCFRHGPGKTSDTNLSFEKFENEFDPSSPIVGHFGIDRFNETHDQHTERFISLSMSGHRPRHVAGTMPAKVIMVPKDSRGPRIISCEPVIRQFVQQGIRNWTQERLETHPISSGHINFSDQTINRHLALEKSKDKSYSTIDLKSASDLVSLACVQYLFEHCPIYLKSLTLSRSSHSEIEISSDPKSGGNTEIKTVTLRKFAPMGSAVCFTTLAWVVYALAYATIYLQHPEVRDPKEVLYVYGDDIIVATPYAVSVMDSLELHGLLVNREKSFVDSHFLESCGMDAFKGVSVTPIRARDIVSSALRPKTREELHAKLLDSKFCEKIVKTVALANELNSAGFPSSAEYLYRVVEGVLKRRLPFGVETSPFLCRVMPSTEIAWFLNSDKRVGGREQGSGTITGLFKVAHKTSYNETGYGRLRRILPSMGQECLLPREGEIDKPRSYNLRTRKLTRWYAGAYVAKTKKVLQSC